MEEYELRELEQIRIILGITDENNPLYKFIKTHKNRKSVTHIYEGMFSHGMGVLDY